MTILIVATIIVVVVVGYMLWQFLKGPFKLKITASGDLTKFFEDLLYRGYDGGFLVIETLNKEPFIQFTKYLTGTKNPGLHFHFPRAKWSMNYYAALKSRLDESGYDYEIVETDPSQRPESTNPVHEFIRVDLKQDLEAASKLARLTLLDVFGLQPNEMLRLYLRDVSPFDEKIGF